jgi:dihydroflavonol-4-reductase
MLMNFTKIKTKRVDAMSNLTLVTGANGHVGNNLVRALLNRGETVRATVRNTANRQPFQGLNCDLVYADLMNKESLRQALAGVDTLYQVAAVLKTWSTKPEEEIIRPNLEGTRNVLEAAAETGVRRIVYVSSVATLDKTQVARDGAMDETCWNPNTYGNAYYDSKILSEKLAWELAEQHNLNMVSVLPSMILGPECFRATPAFTFLQQVLAGKIFADANFHFNFVDVRDLVEGMIAAKENGRSGQRYILATENSLSFPQIYDIAREFVPDLHTPRRLPKSVVMAAAGLQELTAHLTGGEPMVSRSQVNLYYGKVQTINIDKARRELGYAPRSPEQALRESFAYLQAGAAFAHTPTLQMAAA